MKFNPSNSDFQIADYVHCKLDVSRNFRKRNRDAIMKLFTDINECINYSEKAIKQYSFISDMVMQSDYDKWTNKLEQCDDFEDFLVGENSKLNVLNTSVLIGYCITKSHNDSLFSHYKNLFKKLNTYLETFPELIKDKKFNAKLKNLENLNFLSTLSELSLAFSMRKLGLNVKFETKFIQLKSAKKRDVDISVSDKNGNELHFEVYMPNKQLDLNGFFNPNQEDSHFSTKIDKKLFDKFGVDGISGLNGLVLLAINKVFFDMIHVKTCPPPFMDNDNVYNDLVRLIPKDVSGLYIYEDDFSGENSFKFERIILT